MIIAETGWPNQGSNTIGAVTAPDNATKYFINTINWKEEKEVKKFYFSSFDESWRVHHEGDVG